MLSMTVNGQPCDPAFCLVNSPGNWTVSASAFATGQVVDTTYSMQSINPHGIGGHVSIIVTSDAPTASSLSTALGGNGTAACNAVIANGQIVESTDVTVGADASSGGDCQAQWTAAPPPPPCTINCEPPPCTVNCQPPPCSVNCEPPPPPPCVVDCQPPPCTVNCSPPPTCTIGVNCPSVQPIPTLDAWDIGALIVILAVIGIVAMILRERERKFMEEQFRRDELAGRDTHFPKGWPHG